VKDPNYLKSNSLGILYAGEAHHYYGPTVLHWEGGYAGERKIQEVKPLLSIKRDTANWEMITLRRLYQLETINRIRDQLLQQANLPKTKSRESEGLLKVYGNKLKLNSDVELMLPLSGAVSEDNRIWVACRPTGASSRSKVLLVEITFDDIHGQNVSNICWMSPISLSNNQMELNSMADVMSFAKRFVLMLPKLDLEGQSFTNNYYVVGHDWTERLSNGMFETSVLNMNAYSEWLMNVEGNNNDNGEDDDDDDDDDNLLDLDELFDDEILARTDIISNPISVPFEANHFVL
jgi:hypothetical protein